MIKILGISGSLRRESYNTRLLQEARELLPEGVELELYENLKALPPYDQDDDRDPAPPEVERLRAAILAADGLLIATPEYNHSLPGQLKHALDWASRPAGDGALRGKDAAVVGASASMFGAVWAQAEARKVLAAAGARVIDAELPVARAQDSLPLDEEGRAAYAEILGSLVREIEQSLTTA